MSEVPPYITPSQVGKASDMSTKRARRFLQRSGILEKIGGHWLVSESRLRERLPDMYDRVFHWFVLADQKRPETPKGDQ
jgi:hypothetical protein